jgi:hypothetical protein
LFLQPFRATENRRLRGDTGRSAGHHLAYGVGRHGTNDHELIADALFYRPRDSDAGRHDDARQISATFSGLLELSVSFRSMAPKRDSLTLIGEQLGQRDPPAACPNNSNGFHHNLARSPNSYENQAWDKSPDPIRGRPWTETGATRLLRLLSPPSAPTIRPAHLPPDRSAAHLACSAQ